jgi:FkbM family methyltransferase
MLTNMTFWKSLSHRWTGKLVRSLGRIGVDVAPLTSPTGRYSGATIRWRPQSDPALRGAVISAKHSGQPVRFFVANDLDLIQRQHRLGSFYEPEELEIISRHFTGGCFVDIGANVGNHSLYMLKFGGADRVVAFEPQPEAALILELNLALNGVSDRAKIHRKGLSDASGFAGRRMLNNNLGATYLVPGDEGGGFELVRGDDVLADTQVDFIKIDTEGLEMRVLEGLRSTLATQKPNLFVELENRHVADFEAFLSSLNYKIADQYRRYDTNINMLAIPAADRMGIRKVRGKTLKAAVH